jgi:glycosyltransferase involved in cell wall biosynthesis
MPQLSIIIPTYNSAGTIQRCLRSIRIQTFTDYEIVIQDGASSDRTVELIQEFQHENPGVKLELEQEPDKGVYDAMNKGVAKARGEWLYFLGSDDEFYDENVLGSLMTVKNTAGCDVVYGNVQVVGDAHGVKSGFLHDGQFNLRKLLNKNICHQAIFYRASFAKQIGDYNTDYVVLADWDFNLRCRARTRFRYIDIIVAKFYVGGISRSGLADERFTADYRRNVLNYFHFLLLDPFVDFSGFIGLVSIWEQQLSKGRFWESSSRTARRMIRYIGRIRKSALPICLCLVLLCCAP